MYTLLNNAHQNAIFDATYKKVLEKVHDPGNILIPKADLDKIPHEELCCIVNMLLEPLTLQHAKTLASVW